MSGASFASDNHAGVHPEVLAAIVEANSGPAPAYGDDAWTARATELLRREFGPDAGVFLVFNGTGANVVGLQAMMRPYEAVVCAATAHINVDECGAPERFLGSKLIDLSTADGKLTPDAVEAAVWGVGDQHHVQARVVSITQSTELGTVYTVEEIRALADRAHSLDLLLHLDGARIANAAASLGVGLGDLGRAAGVDVLSFGATKNGALGAEAVVVLRPDLVHALPFIRKQSMQLASKMRYAAAQIVALLDGDLWLRNAAHANAMATRLADAVRDLPGVRLDLPVQANGLFPVLDPAATSRLQEAFPFYVWDEGTGQVRWMTSWATTPEDVDSFAAAVRDAVAVPGSAAPTMAG
jgi:threonine aldolase